MARRVQRYHLGPHDDEEEMSREEVNRSRPSRTGKQPALRPQPSSSASKPVPTANISKTKAKAKKRAVTRNSLTHRMTTRSKARIFRLMDLPPELRMNIFQHAFATSQDRVLSGFTLPPLLSTSKKINSEALSVFFEGSTWVVEVRSNWCMRLSHYHGPSFVRHQDTGIIYTDDRLEHLPEEAVRFRDVLLKIGCVCCHHRVWIMVVKIMVKAGQVVFNEVEERVSHNKTAETAIQGMLDNAEDLMTKITKREKFNGLTVRNLEDVGLCFRGVVQDRGGSVV